MSGQAASYYDPNQGFNAAGQGSNYTNTYQERNGNYQNYPPQQNYQQPTVESKPPPPPYPENTPPPQSSYSFDEAFKIEKPKFNDLWAGLLVRNSLIWSDYSSTDGYFS